MARHIAHYTLVRLLPQSDSGEFANMGVVVACPALGFFDFRLITRYRRITQFFEEFNRELFTQVRREVEAGVAMTEDPRQLLDQVFARYVQRSSAETRSRREDTMVRLVREALDPAI